MDGPSPQRSFFEPGFVVVLKDFVYRAIKGELHLPPWWLRDVGGADFKATGQEFLRLFRELGDLQPDERILEIGCGSGRMAIPLTSYLSQAGSYTGMDITLQSILWCQRNISRRRANFRFLHADLYNKRYNPSGRYLAKEYTFPFASDSFDFIFLTSVFTHLLPEVSHTICVRSPACCVRRGVAYSPSSCSTKRNNHWPNEDATKSISNSSKA